eukprot:m.13621 g.13621  ORF g.13621 m.13621 type:complete len:130 (+) comp3064_c0_seq1:309-698(+)
MAILPAALVIITVGGLCTSRMAPQFVREALGGLVSQLFWMLFLVLYLPALWCYFLGLDSLSAVQHIDPTRLMMVTGAAMVAGGHAYTQLPIDLIPDWVPLIGLVDDAVARLIMIVGGLLMCVALVTLAA